MNELIKLLQRFPNKPWNWHYLSRNPNLTIEDIKLCPHPHGNWKPYYLSANPNITMRDVLVHPADQWDWYELSQNPGITMKDVDKYPKMPWNWHALSMNPSITMKDVLAHQNKPWNWGFLSENRFSLSPRMTKVFIRKMGNIRIKHRREIQLKILYSRSALCIDLIHFIVT